MLSILPHNYFIAFLRYFAKRSVHLLAAAADRYVRGKEGRVENNSSDSVPQGGREGGTKGETDSASCADRGQVLGKG